ncbi:hypothetical protein NIES2119_30220 [[Phormidium ambiguum] IAM M-71]|uniref:ABM domain-containing protein n=1 Tax=[Phormidium ambiguum] IAM M-71 TaxID=454136 RepID=A0A1U7I3V4_9CYAN|nr:antibiotic biosynthesis monooxygenase [Phormidium ambiguum]OKH30767.1 hypothetical protein NIES2119_30220 [Phormidium ambiguum IAM M-71]
MLKQAIDRAKILIITCLLMLGFSLTFPSSAQAGTGKALEFATASSSVEVATIYETSFTTQKSVGKSLKVGSKLMKKAPGFQGFSMWQSQDGTQLVVFSQWQDLASYQAYAPNLTAVSSKTTAATPPTPTSTLIFEVVSVQPGIKGATPALRGKEAVVQLTQFIAKNSEDRSQILTQVTNMIPELLEKQPIPQSVMLLKGVETEQVALLTNWNCSALFADVGEPVAIEPSSDLVALADNEHHLYNVVTIVPAEVKEEE